MEGGLKNILEVNDIVKVISATFADQRRFTIWI